MNFVLSDCYFALCSEPFSGHLVGHDHGVCMPQAVCSFLFVMDWCWPRCHWWLWILPCLLFKWYLLPGLCACISSSYNAIKSIMKMTDIEILQWSFTVDIQWSLPRVSWHSLLLLPFQVTVAHTFFSSSEETVLSLGCSVGLLGPWDLSFTHTHLEFCRSTILLFETFQFFIFFSGF